MVVFLYGAERARCPKNLKRRDFTLSESDCQAAGDTPDCLFHMEIAVKMAQIQAVKEPSHTYRHNA